MLTSKVKMRLGTIAMLPLALALTRHATADEPCRIIHGRAHFYGGDGQLRIWNVGTHHDYEPDETSWSRVLEWLDAGVKAADKTRWASPTSTVYLFGDFLICPTDPFKKGSVQRAVVKSFSKRRYVPAN